MEEAARAATERKLQVGRRIAACRLAKRWKQKQLAAAVNVETLTVSRWERGRHMPDLDMLDLIAAELNTTAGFLLDGPMRAGEGAEDDVVPELLERLGALEQEREADRVEAQRQREMLAEILRLAQAERDEREATREGSSTER
jgi:transcriptional regulator with XRE-family HTH domain